MFRTHPSAPCKHCLSSTHASWHCFLNPKRKKLGKYGKYTKQWIVTRHEWIKKHPPNHNGTWVCYLQLSPQCPRYLTLDMLTLDHIKSRSRHPELRFDPENLQPCCYWCNDLKGSKELAELQP